MGYLMLSIKASKKQLYMRLPVSYFRGEWVWVGDGHEGCHGVGIETQITLEV